MNTPITTENSLQVDAENSNIDKIDKHNSLCYEAEIPTTLPPKITESEQKYRSISIDEIKAMMIVFFLSFVGSLLFIWTILMCHRSIGMLSL